MIFNDIKYKTGCIEYTDYFDIESIKFTILKDNLESPSCRLEIQMMIRGNYYKKLYFTMFAFDNELHTLKKRLSRKSAIKFIQTILKFEPMLVNYRYLPEDDRYYTRVKSLEVYYDD